MSLASILTGHRVEAMLVGLCCLLVSCNSAHMHVTESKPKPVSAIASHDKIYVPKYYVYRNGHYKFVRGYYRVIFSKKNYWKKSLRGYVMPS